MTESLASRLMQPISPQAPAGEDLYEMGFYAEIENPRIFGSDFPLPGDAWSEDAGVTGRPIDWRRVRARALEGLQRSRDLRALNLLAAAVIRLEGIGPFFELIKVAAAWLDQMPDQVHPLFEDDGIYQANTLANFEDRMAILEPFRRNPFVTDPAWGNYSLRDLEIARGTLATDQDDPPTEEQIMAALRSPDRKPMLSLRDQALDALAHLTQIDHATRQRSPDGVGVSLASLRRETQALHLILAGVPDDLPDERAASPAPTALTSNDAAHRPAVTEASATRPAPLTQIKSRDDARRALDSVAAYFREHEPSSAVPLLAERAKRLIGLGFLEVMSELAPDSVAPLRDLAGLRDEPLEPN
jgi:type VI secretion system protein ImpA